MAAVEAKVHASRDNWYDTRVTNALVPAPASPPKILRTAGVLAMLGALPLASLTIGGVVRLVDKPQSIRDLALCVLVFAFGPLTVVITSARMMWSPKRPLALFVVAVILSQLLTFLGASLAAIGGGGDLMMWLLLGCFLGSLAIIFAIIGAIQRVVAKPRA